MHAKPPVCRAPRAAIAGLVLLLVCAAVFNVITAYVLSQSQVDYVIGHFAGLLSLLVICGVCHPAIRSGVASWLLKGLIAFAALNIACSLYNMQMAAHVREAQGWKAVAK